jgi:hypothetical protein
VVAKGRRGAGDVTKGGPLLCRVSYRGTVEMAFDVRRGLPP